MDETLDEDVLATQLNDKIQFSAQKEFGLAKSHTSVR